MITILGLLLFSCVLNLTKGECPSSLDIPVANDDGIFTCATYWKGPGADSSINACNSCDYGDRYTMLANETMMGEPNSHYPMGTVFVKAGCTLYLSYDNDLGGEQKELGTGSASVNYYNQEWGRDGAANCAPGPGSYRCRCVQQPVTCVPSDAYSVVLYCDNTPNNVTSAKCTYMHTIGTTYEETFTDTMEIDVALAAEMKIQFFGLFSASLGLSVETGFDWTHTSTAVQSDIVTIRVSADAPPGMVLTIEQTVGHCDGSTVNTDMFRTSTYTKDGSLVSRKIERLPIDGMTNLIDMGN